MNYSKDKILLDKFLWAQNNMSIFICKELFNELGDHIYKKWWQSNYNFLNFMTRLDENNQQIVLEWIHKNYNIF